MKTEFPPRLMTAANHVPGLLSSGAGGFVFMDNQPEIWKPIVGLVGKYEISSLGRVKSVSRLYVRKNGWPLRTSLTRNAYLTGLLNGLAVGILVGFCYTIFVEWLGR